MKVKGTAQRKPTLVSVGEAERLRAEIAEEERYLHSARGGRPLEGFNPEAGLSPQQARSIDAEAIAARIARKKKALERMLPQNYRLVGAARQRASKRMKELEAFFRKNMISTFDMGAYPKGDNHEKHQNYLTAVEKSFAQEVGNPRFNELAHEYKELARRMEPEDPELPDLERFRPRRRY